MPMSAEAFDGLRAVVSWNPYGARLLLGILREHPTWVKRKDDPYGPLHLIQHSVEYTQTTSDRRVAANYPRPFPIHKAGSCERFGGEWLRHDFTPAELADAIEGILRASGEDTT